MLNPQYIINNYEATREREREWSSGMKEVKKLEKREMKNVCSSVHELTEGQ